MIKYFLTFKLRKENIAIIVMIVFIIYNLLVSGLVHVEQMSPQANINGYAKAFWYSMTVIITIGYSNLFPVTEIGRLIGFGFVVLSLVFYLFVIIKMARIYIAK